MKGTIFALSALAAAFLDAATIDRMVVRQQWPWNGKVRVEYIVSGATAPQDVSVAISQDEQAVDVSGTDRATFLVGDLHGVANGVHSFAIDADQLPASVRKDADVTVSLALADSPAGMTDAIYMIVDLVNASNITYVSRADLLDGKYGTYETDYSAFGSNFSTPLSCPIVWTGVTNDVKYMTTHMVLRKISVANQAIAIGTSKASSWSGYGTRDKERTVKLTSDYWIGVFEVTQEQYAKMGVAAVAHRFNNAAYAATRPAETIKYDSLRGTNLGAKWEKGVSIATARQVDNNTWFDVFRKRTGLERLDLPSGAQWEIACMAANTSTPLYSGENYATTSIKDNSNTKDANLDKLARYKWNGGYTNVWGNASYPAPEADCDTSLGTAKVGSYAPNAYGLYDMLGNVSEWALDYLESDPDNTVVQVNPMGGTKSDNGRRVRRGGGWSDTINVVVTRWGPAISYAGAAEGHYGFRVCYTEHDDEASEEVAE